MINKEYEDKGFVYVNDQLKNLNVVLTRLGLLLRFDHRRHLPSLGFQELSPIDEQYTIEHVWQKGKSN